MPKKVVKPEAVQAAPVAAQPAAITQPGTAPGPESNGKKAPRQRPEDFDFAMFFRRKNKPQSFHGTAEELVVAIEKLPAHQQANVVVYKRVGLKVETKITGLS